MRRVATLIMGEMEDKLRALSNNVPLVPPGEEIDEAPPLDLGRDRCFADLGPLAKRRQQVPADDRDVAPRPRGDPRPANDERDADPPLPHRALAAAQASAPTAAAGTVVGGVDHVGRAGEPEPIDGVEDHADGSVEILGDRRHLGTLPVATVGGELRVLRFGLRKRVPWGMERIPGELHVERLARLSGTAHEVLGALGHPKQIDRIGIGEGKGLLVAGVAVMVVVAVFTRATAADVPLAIVGRRVAGRSHQFADRDELVGDRFDDPRLDHPVTGLGRCGLRPMEGCGGPATLDADPRRRADRRRGVGIRESPPLCGQGLQTGRVENRRCRNIGGHRHRQPIPSLIVRDHEDDIRPIVGDRGFGRGESPREQSERDEHGSSRDHDSGHRVLSLTDRAHCCLALGSLLVSRGASTIAAA